MFRNRSQMDFGSRNEQPGGLNPDTKKVTPSKVTKKRAPKTTPSRSPTKGTPSKVSSSATRGSSDDADKYFLWLCFLHNGGKP
ncbi:unnamed protein product, partial [Penicillium manginii]